jgi:hypothetical protein
MSDADLVAVVQKLAEDFHKDPRTLWVRLSPDNKNPGELVGHESEPRGKIPACICFSKSKWGDSDEERARRVRDQFIPCVLVKKGKSHLNVEPGFHWLPDELRPVDGQVARMSTLFARKDLPSAKAAFFEMLAPLYQEARTAMDDWLETHRALQVVIESSYLVEADTSLRDDEVWTWKVRRKEGDAPLDGANEEDRKVIEFLAGKAGVDDEELVACTMFEDSSFATDMAGTTAELVAAGWKFVQFDRLAG